MNTQSRRVVFASVCLVATSSLPCALPIQAQVQVKARAIELELSGRLQFQVQTSSCSQQVSDDTACTEPAPAFDMLLRRARFSLQATIDDRLTVKVEPGFAPVVGISLKDAWGRYAFGPSLSLKAGHFKRPFDGYHMESSSQLPFERAVLIPGAEIATLPSHSELTFVANLSDRDIGAMLEGDLADGHLEFWLGVFTGGSDARARDTNSEKQFIGRAQVSLGSGESPVEVAAALAITDAPYVALNGDPAAKYYTDYELWASRGAWDRDGLLVQVGIVAGDNPRRNARGEVIDLAAGESMASLFSWQGVAAYRMPVRGADWLEAVTPFARVSFADPTGADDDGALGVTPGVAFYFHGRNRLALSWDFASPQADGLGTEHSMKAQMQFHF